MLSPPGSLPATTQTDDEDQHGTGPEQGGRRAADDQLANPRVARNEAAPATLPWTASRSTMAVLVSFSPVRLTSTPSRRNSRTARSRTATRPDRMSPWTLPNP